MKEIEKLAKKVEEIDSLKNEIKKITIDNIKNLFVENEKLERILIGVNNHEFNDGDATRFYVNYDEFEIKYDGEDYSPYETDDIKEVAQIRKKIKEIFKETDRYNIHEFIFGDEYEEISFKRKEVIKNV